ncbi:Conserved hypothetical protein [gamma proteobacterium HdN1]|nr:Conserved hypothetical protein [gamma proteobacterium HdN1]
MSGSIKCEASTRHLLTRRHPLTRRPRLLAALIAPASLLAGFSAPVQADTLWSGMRDGVVHIQKTGSSSLALQLQWKAVWIADSQEERVYFQNPDGTLIRRVNIAASQQSGNTTVNTPASTGVYRVEVPGVSFRAYDLQIPGSDASMIEPVKVHQAMSVKEGTSFYFKVPANRSFKLCGKNYGGVDSLTITPTTGGAATSLKLTKYSETEYPRYDSTTIAAASEARVFKLELGGSGKISFWVDDIPNLFAQQASALFDLKPADANTQITIGSAVGDTPKIGAAMPFADPPSFSWPLIDSWGLQSTNFYFFQDTLTKNLDADKAILNTFQNRFHLQNAVSILSNTGRQPLIEDTAATTSFLERYLKRRHEDGLLKQAYIAFSDEPNLNYSDVDEFEKQFVSIATALKQNSDPSINSTLIAAPQSSRFWNGPTRDGSETRRGSDMAERLLSSHYDLFDALSWHEWLVRDLIATEWYNESITRAWDLMKRYQPAGKPEKALVIAQTNISSGYSLSPYDQDTFFASLWWTSVVAQSARTGKLSSLVWFKAADDGLYNKGLASLAAASYTTKPVSDAMRFVTQHLGEQALATQSSHPELDAVATLDNNGRLQILGVNKGEHHQRITLTLPRKVKSVVIDTLDENGAKSTGKTVDSSTITIELPAKTIFGVSEDLASIPPSPPGIRLTQG